jgi:hypothetical protein
LENKKKNGTFFEIINGLRKNILNQNFADIGTKKGCYQCKLTRICPEKFFLNFNLTDVSLEKIF